MQHAPVIKNQHVARLQGIAPLHRWIIGHLVKAADAGIKRTHVPIRQPHGIAVVIIEGDLCQPAISMTAQNRTIGAQNHPVTLIDASHTDAGQIIINRWRFCLQRGGYARAINHDGFAALCVVLNT